MNTRNRIVLILLIILFIYILLAAAWVADDAYITLRTVDNFVNGYGLRWNVAERVQSYTHPLWMFTLSTVYFLTRHAYFTALFVSFMFSLASLIIVARQPNAALGLVILMFSKAFVDFSVSGLENPATHLLLVAFLLVFLKKEAWIERDILLMGLFAAFITLNRVDAALFFVPALFFVLWMRRSASTVGILGFGFLPFFLWEIFSLFYYGFLVPNTAYAKLNTGISRLSLLSQGLVYLVDSFQRDPITLIVITAGLILAFWKGGVKERLLALGVSLYILYVFSIGGDFMSGRFFSAALLVAVLLLMRLLNFISLRWKIAIAALAVLVGLIAPYPTVLPRTNQPPYTENDVRTGINDERAFYYQTTGLSMVFANGGNLSDSKGWVEHGLALRNSGKTVAQENNIGFVGYYVGPEVYLVDIYALSDPLLARLPIPDPLHWRVGHYERKIPAGYIESLKSGAIEIKDPALAVYYQKLSLITRGPLWSITRLRTIWEMNTGQYNYLLVQYKP